MEGQCKEMKREFGAVNTCLSVEEYDKVFLEMTMRLKDTGYIW